MTLEFRNDRSGEVVSTELGKKEILASFLEHSKDDNWLWYWLAKSAEERRAQPDRSSMIAFLADSFLLACGMGLKRPMIRLHLANRRYKVYLSRPSRFNPKGGTLCVKTGALVDGTNDPTGDETYMGRLSNGRFVPSDTRPLQPLDQIVVDSLSKDPAGFLSQVSKDMNRCCYCGLPLEDQRSMDVGYGPICAGRWGLPWGLGTGGRVVPSFADMWGKATPGDQKNVRGICDSIRKNPRDSFLWGLLGDVLEEAGYQKRPEMPERSVTLPSS